MDSLKDVIKNTDGQQRSILLGNGFILAAGYSKFDYSSLADSVSEKLTNNTELKDLIIKKGEGEPKETNLELFLKHFQEAIDALDFFNDTSYINACQSLSPLQKKIQEDMISLKKKTLDIIKNIHPNNYDGKIKEFEKCAKNLGKFNYIFTINYDYILYWLILYINKINKDLNIPKFRDGMSEKYKYNDNYQEISLHKWRHRNNNYNVFFLHGAIHLIEDKEKNTCKVIRKDNNQNLREIVDYLLKVDEFKNIIVLEGSTDEKKRYINSNEYLKKGLIWIADKKGILIIYGCSLVNDHGEINNDQHIWQRIVNSKFSSIYIGIFEDDPKSFTSRKNAISTALEKEHLAGGKKMPEINFFTTKRDDIWSAEF